MYKLYIFLFGTSRAIQKWQLFWILDDMTSCCHFLYRPKNILLHEYHHFFQKLFDGRCTNYIYSCSGNQGLSKNDNCFENWTIWFHDVILLRNKMAAMTSLNYANEPKNKHKQLNVCRTICAKFQQNRPSRFATNPLTGFLVAILNSFSTLGRHIG